jgi:hypothetical protein
MAESYKIDYTIKQNDVGRTISGQFRDANDAVVDCTGNTSRKVFMRRQGRTTLKINGTSFSFSNVALGKFIYQWAAADLDTVGDYEMEFQTTLPGGVVVTFPTDVDKPYLLIRVQDDLG